MIWCDITYAVKNYDAKLAELRIVDLDMSMHDNNFQDEPQNQQNHCINDESTTSNVSKSSK